MLKAYVKRIVPDTSVERMFYNVLFTHVLRTFNVYVAIFAVYYYIGGGFKCNIELGDSKLQLLI